MKSHENVLYGQKPRPGVVTYPAREGGSAILSLDRSISTKSFFRCAKNCARVLILITCEYDHMKSKEKYIYSSNSSL